MAQTRILLSLTEVTDCDTGMYSIGDLSFSIHVKELEEYLKYHGYAGKKEILAVLGHLAYQVETYFREANIQVEYQEVTKTTEKKSLEI